MHKQKNTYLFELIKSLSKGEKRQFKLYAARNFSGKDLKIVQLFDVIDKLKEHDSAKISKSFSDLSQSGLSNLKTNLYEQLLSSLKITQRNTKEIKALDMMNFARVLYKRGLYQQSLASLLKAKNIAKEIDDKNLLFDILSFEKRIELLHNTNSHNDRADELISEQSNQLIEIQEEIYWSNLSLELYDFYLKFGHVKNADQFAHFEEKYLSKIEVKEPQEFLGKIHRQMSLAWYYFISQDFLKYYKHSIKWVELFEEYPEKIDIHPVYYLKGIHNTLSALYYCNKPRQFQKLFEKFEAFLLENYDEVEEHLKNVFDVYLFTHRLNSVFLQGEFTENNEKIEEWVSNLKCIEHRINEHRFFLFQYKLACLCFGANNFSGAIKFLNNIVNADSTHIRQDIQCFGRILKLIAHFEKEDDDFLEYEIKNTYRFLLKLDDVNKIQKFIIDFLKQSIYTSETELKDNFIQLLDRIEQIQFEKFETRPLLYLDLHGWLKGKVKQSSTEEEIKIRQAMR